MTSSPQRPYRRRKACLLAAAFSLSAGGVASAQARREAPDDATPSPAPPATAHANVKPAPARSGLRTSASGAGASDVVVTASRLNLLGLATSASQGVVTRQEIELRPIFRVGQLFETVPGLVVTVHSGEGKANQYLLRGFNLDHGTDFASFVDAMPVNKPTNTHGQGYSDQNFVMPQLVAGLDFTKGPYYASLGDSGAVGSARLRLIDTIPNTLEVSAGTLGDQEVFLAGTHAFGPDDRLLAAVDYAHLDGPWTHPDNFHRLNLELRYSHGDAQNGYSLTGLYDHNHGNLTTDQPLRAVQEGLIDRFGSLDASDGSRTERYSLSARFARTAEASSFTAGAYVIHSRMTLWNDFTHLLDDPVNGDQEEQTEARTTGGGEAAYKLRWTLGGITNVSVVGAQARYDELFIDRRHTLRRAVLDYCATGGDDTPAPLGACNADRVSLLDLAPYVENTTYWTPWLRTVLGLREEYYRATDHSLVSGFKGATDETLAQPKGSLVLGPFRRTELYLSAGRGFHSDDVRGVFGTVPQEGLPGNASATPLLAPAVGEEIGLRTNIVPRLQVQVALFQEDFDSELAYDADAGEDTASAPSRRRGVEVSAQYHPLRWLELNTDLAVTRARYRGDLAPYGLDGPHIANAPEFISSFGLLVNNLGRWSGGLQWRILGPYPISDGDKDPKDDGYAEMNLDANYQLTRRIKLRLAIYNLTDTRADAAAYYYAARLPGEPAGGIPDYQIHPLEPISARFTLAVTF